MKGLKNLHINEDKYRGQWVAFDPKTNKVAGHGKSIHRAKEGAAKRGVKKPVLYAVPKSDAYFVGAG